MNIPLYKTLLLFCLVAATTAQVDSPTISTNSPSSTTTPSTNTSDAMTEATNSTESPSSTTPSSTNTSDAMTEATKPTERPSSTTPSSTITSNAMTEATNSTERPFSTTHSSTNTSDAMTEDNTSPTTITTTATTTQGPCASSVCLGDSTCEERFGGLFACICRPGLVYSENNGCVQTKVFPAKVTLDEEYEPQMADKASKEFQSKAEKIENKLRKIFEGQDGYVKSTVLRLTNGSIIAEVQNFFQLTSNTTSQLVEELFNNSKEFIRMCPQLPLAETTVVDLCDVGHCDSTTTDCKDQKDGTATCLCKDDYVRNEFTSEFCVSCPNGEKAVDGKCEKCSFGFSGFNCSDPYLLVVIVVSTVLGALLIIFIVALIVVSCRNQKGSSSSKTDFSSSYGNKDLHKPTGMPKIPRANPDASWNSNNLEMNNSGSSQALVVRGHPESKVLYSNYDEDVNYKSQVPPSYSGYDGRGVENGGVQNPYFRKDDNRMRRY